MQRFNLAVRWPDGSVQGFTGFDEKLECRAREQAYEHARAERPNREGFEVISTDEIEADHDLRDRLAKDWSQL